MKPVLTIDVGGCFAFSPDGTRIAVAKKSPGKKMGKIVDIRTGEEVVSIDRLPANTRSIAYTPSGSFLVFAAMYEAITVCDPSTGNIIRTIKAAGGDEIRHIAITPVTETMIQVTSSALTEIDLGTGTIIRSIDVGTAVDGHRPRYERIAFSQDGRYLLAAWAAGFTSHFVGLVDWPSGEVVANDKTSSDLHYMLSGLCFAPTDQSAILSTAFSTVETVALGWRDSTVSRWFDRSRPRPGTDGLDLAFTPIDLAPEADLFVAGYRDVFELWRWPARELLGEWRLPGKTPTVFEVAFSPNGEHLAIALNRTTIVYRVSDLV